MGGQASSQFDHETVDMPSQYSTSASPEPLTFSLTTVSVVPLSDTNPLPKMVLIKVHPDRAELFVDGDSDDHNAPVARWPFRDIVSWDHNSSVFRVLVVSEQMLSPAAYRNCARTPPPHKRCIRKRTIYTFASVQSAEISASFSGHMHEAAKQNDSGLVAELQETNAVKETEVYGLGYTRGDFYTNIITQSKRWVGSKCHTIQSSTCGGDVTEESQSVMITSDPAAADG